MSALIRARLRGRARRALLAAAVAAALDAAVLPAAANAASVGDGALSSGERSVFVLDRSFFAGGSTESNNASVAVEGDFVVIRDTAGITTEHQGSGGRCFRVSTIEARCPRAVDRIDLNLGAGDDRVEYRAHHKGFVGLGEGNDTVFGGRREASGPLIRPVTYDGGPGYDTVSYVRSDRGVRVDTADGLATDGRPGIDDEDVDEDVEIIEGSNFADVLFGSNANDVLRGLNGDDLIGGGLGADVIDEGTAANGADTINGGDGPDDVVFYRRRTSGVVVTLNGVRNDGAPDEQDDVRPSVEHIEGTDFRDTLVGNGSANAINGFGDTDTIDGLGGNDTLAAGAGGNNVFGGTGNDVIETRNGVADNIDCGENPGDSDTANRDTNELRVVGCERGTVGVLPLSPKRVRAGQTLQAEVEATDRRARRQLEREAATFRVAK
jgi:Ca2+-binding RTX toxin-like protein